MPISGTFRKSVLLAGGRFMMRDDGIGFSLVPGRPVVQGRIGQVTTVVKRSGHVSWGIFRRRHMSR